MAHTWISVILSRSISHKPTIGPPRACALIRALETISPTDCGVRWAFALDSKYVIDGVNGGAEQWKADDWQGKSGVLVSHVDLWIKVLELLALLGDRVSVFHASSHMNLKGNDHTDELADEGRARSPLHDSWISGQFIPSPSQLVSITWQASHWPLGMATHTAQGSVPPFGPF